MSATGQPPRSVLRSSRRVVAPQLHAHLDTDALIHPRYRLHAVRLQTW